MITRSRAVRWLFTALLFLVTLASALILGTAGWLWFLDLAVSQ